MTVSDLPDWVRELRGDPPEEIEEEEARADELPDWLRLARGEQPTSMDVMAARQARGEVPDVDLERVRMPPPSPITEPQLERAMAGDLPRAEAPQPTGLERQPYSPEQEGFQKRMQQLERMAMASAGVQAEAPPGPGEFSEELGRKLMSGLEAGTLGTAQGLAGALSQPAEAVVGEDPYWGMVAPVIDPLTAPFRESLARHEERIKGWREAIKPHVAPIDERDFWDRFQRAPARTFVLDTAEVFTQMAPMIVAAAASGGAAGMATSMAQMGGPAYTIAMEETGDPRIATNALVMNGIIGGMLEYAPVGRAIRRLKGAKGAGEHAEESFVRFFLKQTGGEAGTEAMQTYAEKAVEYASWGHERGMTLADLHTPEALAEYGQAALLGAGAGAVTAVGVEVPRRLMQRPPEQAALAVRGETLPVGETPSRPPAVPGAPPALPAPPVALLEAAPLEALPQLPAPRKELAEPEAQRQLVEGEAEVIITPDTTRLRLPAPAPVEIEAPPTEGVIDREVEGIPDWLVDQMREPERRLMRGYQEGLPPERRGLPEEMAEPASMAELGTPLADLSPQQATELEASRVEQERDRINEARMMRGFDPLPAPPTAQPPLEVGPPAEPALAREPEPAPPPAREPGRPMPERFPERGPSMDRPRVQAIPPAEPRPAPEPEVDELAELGEPPVEPPVSVAGPVTTVPDSTERLRMAFDEAPEVQEELQQIESRLVPPEQPAPGEPTVLRPDLVEDPLPGPNPGGFDPDIDRDTRIEARVLPVEEDVVDEGVDTSPTEAPPRTEPIEGKTEAGFVGKKKAKAPRENRWGDDERAKRVEQAKKGPPKKGWRQRVIDTVETVTQPWRREYKHIPTRDARFVSAREGFRSVQAEAEFITSEIERDFNRILGKDSLTDEEHDLFIDKMTLDSMRAQHRVSPDAPLPFGYTPAEINGEVGARIDEAFEASERAQWAVKEMRNVWRQTRDDVRTSFEEAGLNAEWIDRYGDDYMHHQVLEYAALKDEGTRVGQQIKEPRGRGFQKGRKGTTKDINLDYSEAQGNVLAQLKIDAKIARVIARFKRDYDAPARAEAEAQRDAAVTAWKEGGAKGRKPKLADFIPEGYTVWHPGAKSNFFSAWSVSDYVANRAISEGFKEITGKDLHKVLAQAPRQGLMLPKEVVAQLDEQATHIGQTKFGEWWRKGQTAWKQWQLLSPMRAEKYLFRNLVSDFSKALTWNPGTVKHLKGSAGELASYIFSGKAAEGDLKTWLMLGGGRAGLFGQELGTGDRQRQANLDRDEMQAFFSEVAGKNGVLNPVAATKKWFKLMRKNAAFLEAVTRYAAYKDYMAQLEANNGQPKNWGSSVPVEINALASNQEKAYWLSNQLIGAYDQVSVYGQMLRANAIPFWSFQEINVTSHWQLWRNALEADPATQRAFAKKLGLRLAGKAAWKGAWGSVMFGAKAYAFEIFAKIQNQMTMWMTGDDELERDLPSDVRRRPHLLLPRMPNGNVAYFDRLGAFGELREFWGVDAGSAAALDYFDGRKTLGEAASEFPLTAMDNLFNASTPLGPKTAAELAMGSQFFPSIRKARPITDYWDYAASQFGLSPVYRKLAKRPRSGWHPGLLLWYEADPGAASYYDSLSLKNKYREKAGEIGRGAGRPSPKSVALRNFKRAVHYDQKEIALKYLLEYEDLGGTERGVEASFRAMDPLYGLDEEQVENFVGGLSDDEIYDLERGLEYYDEVLLDGWEIVEEFWQ